MEYVIKNIRLRDYLYNLGFTYRKVLDKTHRQEFIYLFKNNEKLHQAITFYTSMKDTRLETIKQ